MVIWKYVLEIKDVQQISMPESAKLLTVQVQNNALCLWALVDKAKPMVEKMIKIYGTGNEIPFFTRAKDYIGTVQMGQLVWHVFKS